MFGIMIALVGFANSSNAKRTVGNIQIIFEDNEALFVDTETVENLLIKNLNDSLNTYKYKLDLAGLERSINEHDMIKSADIYSDIKGNLGLLVTQKKPIARFYDGQFKYIDEEGFVMPLSSKFSARVPLVFGFAKKDISQVYPLLSFIREDEFLKNHIIAIRKNAINHLVELEVRNQGYKVNFGQTEKFNLKFTNYKAFYLKAKEEHKLNDYKSVNLQFGNQVVCTFKS
jgi:cell division protein FtsQ